MIYLFISDLHLCNRRPEKVELFQALLRGPARTADALYILGDLFENWAGDDDITPPHEQIIGELSRYTKAGHKLFIMRGNRDYLLGQAFANKTGGRLLDDITLIPLHGENTLLMHGDTLCTDDWKYQIFRCLVNNTFSRNLFVRLPYAWRLKIYHQTRTLTTKNKRQNYPVDVCQSSVEKIMKKYGASCLIHGHTHKQGMHRFNMGNQTAQRIVLGDWIRESSVLVAGDGEFKLLGVAEYIAGSPQP